MKERHIGFIFSAWLALFFSCAQKPAEKEGPPPQSAEKNISQHGDKRSREGHTAEEEATVSLDRESIQRGGIHVEEVIQRSLKQELRLSGVLQMNEDRLAHVGSRIPGRVVGVSAGLGDHVKKGARLVLIDSPELGQSQSAYLTTKAKLLVAEKAYERARRLVEQKVIGTGEFQRREGEYLATRAEFEASHSRLQLLGMTQEEVERLG